MTFLVLHLTEMEMDYTPPSKTKSNMQVAPYKCLVSLLNLSVMIFSYTYVCLVGAANPISLLAICNYLSK